MNLMFIWLLGSIVAAIDIFNILYTDPTAKFKYDNLDFIGKVVVYIQLGLLCFLGSWLIIFINWIYSLHNKHIKRRK